MDIQTLSVKEKILQTMVVRITHHDFIPDKMGAVFFGGEIITQADEHGVEGARKLAKQYIDNADIPLLITSDLENGCGGMFKGLTPFPYLLSLGATDDEELAYEYGKATAMEARSIGANWTLSPVSDLNLNPWNPLAGERSIGDNPEKAIPLLKQVIRGMQENGLAACAKHFPGDGVDWRDQHRTTTCNSLTMEQWKKYHGKVFQALIDDGVYTIMPGHICLPAYQQQRVDGLALPATLSHELITDLLKGEMGFKGVVVTDALGMGGIRGWYESDVQMCIESFKAGCDMMLWPAAGYVEGMLAAIESGEVSMERLDDAVTRIIGLKEKLGLFQQDNYPKPLSEEEKAYVRQVGARTAEASITLLRNDKGLFPMTPEKCKRIALVPLCRWAPTWKEVDLLCKLLREEGFEVDDYRDRPFGKTRYEGQVKMDEYDMILYANFSRVFRPAGPEEFIGDEGVVIAESLTHAVDKTAIVSFGSPYLMDEYFQRAKTCVNAYSFVGLSVEAFVKAMTGKIPFGTYSPVKVTYPQWKMDE